MIPEKLYIPTSTLNFNSIMSSESLSPASFYPIRGFGYKRFEKVEPNNLDNRIILYSKYPKFNIIDSELENYPMVIEVQSKDINQEIIQEQNGCFFVEETIYLNPFTTKIFFRGAQERVRTISKAEPSIETKMVPLYRNCLVIENKSVESIECGIPEINDSQKDISTHISKDRKINKLKGFLFAYLIAANKSVSGDIVSLKKHVKFLRNTLSSIITNPEGRATYKQEDQLGSLYKLINDKLRSIFLSPLLAEKSKKYQCDFPEMLRQENLFESWLRQNNLSQYQIPQFYVPSRDRDKAFESYFNKLENQILHVENSQKKSKIETSKLPNVQNTRINYIPDQKEFLSKLFNEFMAEVYTSEEFIQSRYEFAKIGGKIFKEELEDKWEGSQWQAYINALLKNLNEYSSFDIKSAKNITLESFAAFCQKGESDIDKLEDYLISSEIGDFNIAYGLWGIIFGFANMPKTLTEDLYSTDDFEYISTVYKHIYKQVHNIDLEGKLEKGQTRDLPVNWSSTVETFKPNIQEDSPIKGESSNQDLQGKLGNCKFLKASQVESICELYQKNHFKLNDKFFVDIKKIKDIGDAKIKKIKNALDYTTQETKTIQKGTLFGDAIPDVKAEFFRDSNIWYHIESIIPHEKRTEVKTEINWIQKVHNDNGYQRKAGEWVKLEDHSNYVVIKHFENNAKNRIEPKLLAQIVAILKELYPQ